MAIIASTVKDLSVSFSLIRKKEKEKKQLFNDLREPLVLPVIEDTDLDLSDLGLEEVLMANDEPKVEEDDVLCPKKPPSPPPIFPPPPFIPEYQTIGLLANYRFKTFFHPR